MVEDDIAKTQPGDWKYINEGACNIVVGYNNDKNDNSVFKGHVLRIAKAVEIERTQEELTRWFSINVVSRLLGRDIACVPQMLNSPGRAWLEELNTLIAPLRYRKDEDKAGIDLEVGQIECLEDVIGGRGISVELKPKWGMLPNPEYLSDETRETKLRHCRFCMHREVKLHAQGDDAEIVRQRKNAEATRGFCPLDLYSGDEKRMVVALDVLVKAWMEGKRGSNLRLFVDGKLLLGKDLEQDKETLAKALEINDNEQAMKEKITKSLVQQTVHVLRSAACLNTLATIQKYFDRIDIEGVAAVLGGHDVALDTDTIRAGCVSLMERREHPANDDRWSVNDYVIGYCISGAFKDCSVVIQLDHPKVKMMDVDLKAVGRVGHYARLDRMIVAHAHARALEPCTP